MKYSIFIGPVQICDMSLKLDMSSIDDMDKMTEHEIDLIIKDSIMEQLRASKESEFVTLLGIIQEAFDMFAAMEFHKKYNGVIQTPTKEEVNEVYRKFMTDMLRLESSMVGQH